MVVAVITAPVSASRIGKDQCANQVNHIVINVVRDCSPTCPSTIKKIEHRFDFIRSHLALVLNSTIPNIYVYIPRVISLEAKKFLSVFTR